MAGINYVLQFGTSSTGTFTDCPIVPQTMSFSFQDVDYDSGRTADGKMHRNRVDVKRKIELTFPPCSDGAKMAALLTAISPVTFWVKYTDPQTNNIETKEFYCGDRAVPVYSYGMGIYDSLSFNIIEV